MGRCLGERVGVWVGGCVGECVGGCICASSFRRLVGEEERGDQKNTLLVLKTDSRYS